MKLTEFVEDRLDERRTCEHGREQCEGKEGLRRGELSCWECYRAASADVLAEYRRNTEVGA